MTFSKIIKIAIVILILVGLGVFIAIFLARAPKESGERPTLREFLPFGTGEPVSVPTVNEPVEVDEEEIDEEGSTTDVSIEQISFFPVAGATPTTFTRLIQTEDEEREEEVPVVRYVHRATGAVYQKTKDGAEERLTESVLPRVYEAFISQSNNVVFRYLKEDMETIITYIATLPEYREGGDSSLSVSGSFLPENTTAFTFSPDTQKMFYLTESSTGVTGTITNADGSNKTVVWTSPFSEWNVEWNHSSRITLTTKPSFSIPGFTYALDPNTRTVSKLLGDIRGLTVHTSPDGKSLLVGEAGEEGVTLSIYTIETKERTFLPFATLPEKCTWTTDSTALYCAIPKTIPTGMFPDMWYQGLISLTDTLWKFDLTANTQNLILDLTQETGQFFDITTLSLDEQENSLFFINKRNQVLWRIGMGQ